MTSFPPPEGDAGATNMPDPNQGALEGGKAVTEALSGSSTWEQVEALAAILEPEAFDPNQPALDEWREDTRNRARAHAAKVINEGWRRVSVDDDTVERVARALLSIMQPSLDWDAADQFWRDVARREARAAVQALRHGGEA